MKEIERLMEKGNAFLGTQIPIISGAMTWISDESLVRAVNAAGAFGVLAGGNMRTEELEQKIHNLKETETRFGVNLITIAPNYLEHLEMVCGQQVSHLIFAGSFPKASEIERVKKSGARVMCFASTVQIANRMQSYGADAIILEGSEAGGHIGPVSTSVLIQEFLFDVKGLPIFIAGGIVSGRMILHLFLMGACGVQMGTRFVASDECSACSEFKESFISAQAKDAIVTPKFDSSLPVIPVRALKNKGMIDFAKLQLTLLEKLQKQEIDKRTVQYEVEHYWVGSLRRAVQEGDVEYGSLMAGQSVGLVNDILPVQKIIERIGEEMEDELGKIRRLLTETG
jgi:enoyl-[acyl-carrier protein] reductase II